jgi:hypothetical protein
VDPLGSFTARGFLPKFVLAVVDEAGSEDAAAGMVGGSEIGPTVPSIGNALGSGTAGAELTPRLPISTDPNGIPVPATPPAATGAVDVGVEDAATLLEPEPHIPDIPDVSNDVVDTPDGTDISDDVDVPGVAVGSIVAAVAGAAAPGAIPPPS